MATNSLIQYHFDHWQKRIIKGINQLTTFHHSGSSNLPVAYELIQKDQQKSDPKIVSSTTKHQLLRRMTKQCTKNNLIVKYVLADCWYFLASDEFKAIADLKKSACHAGVAPFDGTARTSLLGQ